MERAQEVFWEVGITRVSDVTDLDRIGIPVAQAVRPMACALSVSQGKGRTIEAALVGAAMEGIEKHRAETARPDLCQVSPRDVASDHAIVDVSCLVSSDLPPDIAEALPMRWSKGFDLFTGADVFVPFDLVTMDFSRKADSEAFVRSSNGLGSGGTFAEAALSALLEVVERDAMADFSALPQRERHMRRVGPDTIEHLSASDLYDKVLRADVDIEVWDVTNDIGLPTYHVRLRDKPHTDMHDLLPNCVGSGCHLSPSIALSRAITEAAQTRVTVISGTREDLVRQSQSSTRHRDMTSTLLSGLFEQKLPPGPSRPNLAAATALIDLQTVAQALASARISEVAIVDLSLPDHGVFVVRAIVPGVGQLLPRHRFRTGRRHLEKDEFL